MISGQISAQSLALTFIYFSSRRCHEPWQYLLQHDVRCDVQCHNQRGAGTVKRDIGRGGACGIFRIIPLLACEVRWGRRLETDPFRVGLRHD